MKSIKDYMIQVSDVDNVMLTKPLFNVNLRLLSANLEYRKFITSVIKYMSDIIDTKFSDYDSIKGISGANVGIPFNIIIIVLDKRNNWYFINPKYINHGNETRIVTSNCGSINLANKIKVKRFEKILVTYYTLEGKLCEEKFSGNLAATIQHEIDHNNGILITDIA